MIRETHFGFESDGKRFFDITVQGKPKLDQGMTVAALLETRDGWENRGLLGWVDCRDGSIACDSAAKYLGIFLLCAHFAAIFGIAAFNAFENTHAANHAAQFVVALFGVLGLRFLYLASKAYLSKRALKRVRDLCWSSPSRV